MSYPSCVPSVGRFGKPVVTPVGWIYPADTPGVAAIQAAFDAALASAIVGETLRRLPDLDVLIDSATRLPLADDAKARMVLRLALAQKIDASAEEVLDMVANFAAGTDLTLPRTIG